MAVIINGNRIDNVIAKPRKDGTISYLARVSCGYVDGKQKKISDTFEPPEGISERQLEKELRRFVSDLEAKAKVTPLTVQTFSQLIDDWFAEYALVELKPKTYCEYEKMFPRIKGKLGHIPVHELTREHVKEFIKFLRDEAKNLKNGNPLSPTTIRLYQRITSSILSYAIEEGIISQNPAKGVRLPKLAKKEIVYLDEEDIKKLFKLLEKAPIKYRTMIILDLMSGMRRGEMLGLCWGDIDIINRTITIRQTSAYTSKLGVYTDTPKNDTSARTIRLSKGVFSLLEEYRRYQDRLKAICGDQWQDQEGRIFTNDEGRPMHPDTITKWFHKFVKQHDLPPVTIHGLRHTYASLLIADNVPVVAVSRRLGHAQTSTTSNIYTHLINSSDEKAVETTDKLTRFLVEEEEIPEKKSAVEATA